MFKALITLVPGQAAAAGEEVADLETRAVAAVQAGRDDLAAEAAETITGLEAARDASVAARALFADEIAKLKGRIRQPQKPMAG